MVQFVLIFESGPDFLGKVILIVLAKLSSFLDRVLARAPISGF